MAHARSDVKRYHRTKLLVSLVGTVVFLLYAAAWAWWGGGALIQFTEQRWVGLLVFAAIFSALHQVLTLPLDYYGEFVIEHRYELSNQSLTRWFTQTLKGWGFGALIGGIVLCGLYALLWYGGDMWWVWVWLGWLGLTVISVQLFPVLLLPAFYDSAPLEDQTIIDGLTRLAEGTSLKLGGVFKLELSSDTKAANAMLTGLGSTRRVYLSDTLLDAFTPQEIEIVFAHELGHHTRKHIWKMILFASVLASAYIAVLVWFLHPLRGSAEMWRDAVLVIPKIAVCVSVLGLLTAPIQNALSRRFERQCDSDALTRTRNPEAYRSAFTRLAELNLADPEPHPLIEWYFHDHPAMAKRIAMAD